MKKLLLLAAAAFTLCGCAIVSSNGNYSIVGCVENTTSSSFSMQYELFNGTKQYTFKTNQDNEHLAMEFVSSDGKLSVLVKGEDDVEYYKVDNVVTENKTVELGKSGSYTVDFVAAGHKGSFKFTIKK